MAKAKIERKTKETDITLELDTAPGAIEIDTGIGFFDHMLTALFFYAGFSARLKLRGDLHVDAHHSVEDAGIVIGQALREALGDKKGITRFAHAYVPMDEALCFTALDISGRAFHVFSAPMPQETIGAYDACLTEEFMRAFAFNAGITLHQRCEYGSNAHHITEALYKSLGLALKEAVRVSGGAVTSTKGVLA